MSTFRIANTLVFFFWMVTLPMVAFLGMASFDPGIETGVNVSPWALLLFLGADLTMADALFRWDQWPKVVPALLLASAMLSTSLLIMDPAVAGMVPGLPVLLLTASVDPANHVGLFATIYAILFVAIPASTSVLLWKQDD